MQYDDSTTNPIWRMAAVLEIAFGYISTTYSPINAKIGRKSVINNFCRAKRIYA